MAIIDHDEDPKPEVIHDRSKIPVLGPSLTLQFAYIDDGGVIGEDPNLIDRAHIRTVQAWA